MVGNLFFAGFELAMMLQPVKEAPGLPVIGYGPALRFPLREPLPGGIAEFRYLSSLPRANLATPDVDRVRPPPSDVHTTFVISFGRGLARRAVSDLNFGQT
jgi:hypothetical protein